MEKIKQDLIVDMQQEAEGYVFILAVVLDFSSLSLF